MKIQIQFFRTTTETQRIKVGYYLPNQLEC